MQEHVLSLNDFNMPKVYEGADANYIRIIRLLLLEPGKFQSHPYMGVGICSRYRYNNDNNLLQILKNDIKSQIETYLPDLLMTDISLTENNEMLGIIINTADGAYVLSYNGDTNKMDAAASYVLNDLL